MEREALKQHFNEVAGGKDFSSYEARRWAADEKRKAQEEQTRRFIELMVLPHVNGSRHVTELGPGPGTWTKLLFEQAPGAQFLLLDIAQEMLNRARASLPSHAQVTTMEGDFTTLQLAADATDYFFSSRAIEYVAPRDAAVRSIYAHMRTGGKGALITKMPKPIMNSMSGRRPSAIHQGQWSPHTLHALLSQAGFIDIRLYPVSFSFPILRSAAVDRLLGRLFGGKVLNAVSALFAESYGAVFRKP